MQKTSGGIKTRMKKLSGKLRKKNSKGNYYYRLTIANGIRKEFALKTSDETQAIQRAEELDAVWAAPTQEVAFAQINAIKGFSNQIRNISFTEAWEKYETHPDRARPHTIAEQKSYKTSYDEFVSFLATFGSEEQRITGIGDITFPVAESYSAHLRTRPLAVGTHNRKIKHLRKIFNCLKDYYSGDNPFMQSSLFRNKREEQANVVRRQAFSKEQEQSLRKVLDDARYHVINKPEIRVIYYIGMFTGQRLKDCVLLQWQNIDWEQRKIWVRQFKTGKNVTIPIAPELYEVLQEAQMWKINQYVCPKSAARYNKNDKDGKNIGNNLINIDVLRVIRWIGLEPSVEVPGRKKKMTVYGFHSLRHSFASFCAEANVPKAVLLSILGTDSDIADKYYTHVGDASQRKAVEAVSGVLNNKSAQEKIDEVLALLKQKPTANQALIEKIKEILC